MILEVLQGTLEAKYRVSSAHTVQEALAFWAADMTVRVNHAWRPSRRSTIHHPPEPANAYPNHRRSRYCSVPRAGPHGYNDAHPAGSPNPVGALFLPVFLIVTVFEARVIIWRSGSYPWKNAGIFICMVAGALSRPWAPP